MGTPNTPANPALTPQIISLRRFSGFMRNRRERQEAIPAPASAHGASFPADPPTAIVKIDKINDLSVEINPIV